MLRYCTQEFTEYPEKGIKLKTNILVSKFYKHSTLIVQGKEINIKNKLVNK